MNFTKHLLITSLASIALAFSACEQTSPTMPTNTLPTSSATLPPIATSLPLQTATADSLQKAHIVEKCPDILSSSELSGLASGGKIVLLENPHNSLTVKAGFLLDPKSNQRIDIFQKGEILTYTNQVSVSPDRKTLAYGVDTPENNTIKLVLSNNRGERQEAIPIKSDIPYPMYGTVEGWLNNQQLLLDRELFNPYTGEKRSLDPKNFPDISPDDFGVYSLQFDPTLTRVIYPNSHVKTVLADLATKQTLAEIPSHHAGAPEIAWSSNGELVAVVGTIQIQETVADEIFLVDRDGKEIRQITRLSAYYGTKYDLFKLSWSPDGNRIAFWQNDASSNTKGLRLFILDTKTEKLTSYCTWGEPKGITFYGPIWSPNGTQLLIGDLSIEDKVQPVIIDINKNIAVPLVEDAMPVGWMVGS